MGLDACTHLQAERVDARTRWQMLARLRTYLDAGWREPELLYLGARYAASLGIRAEVERFLVPLDELLGVEDGPHGVAAGPLLLRWQVAGSEQDRAKLLRSLEALVFQVPALYPSLRHLGLTGKPPSDTPEARLRHLAERPELLPEVPCAGELAGLANTAAKAYAANDLSAARKALEEMLLLEGDQPDVLRNALVVAGEQQDIEGYERYWRRYVTLLLWRTLRGHHRAQAWCELRDFYLDVAKKTDTALEGARRDAVQELLRRPGFLPRWLEALSALVWLDAGQQGWDELRTGVEGVGPDNPHRGALGSMRFWLRVFYPDLRSQAEAWIPTEAPFSPPSNRPYSKLPFDPVERLCLRTIQWRRIQFAFQGQDDIHGPYGEILRALGGFVLRLPYRRHLPALAARLAEDKVFPQPFEAEPIGQELREAAGLALRARVSKLSAADDWAAVAVMLDDPDLLSGVGTDLALLLALAHCKCDRFEDGLTVACDLLPRMPAEELEEDCQTAGLWKNVLFASLGAIAQGEDLPRVVEGIQSIIRRLEAIPVAPHGAAFKAAIISDARDALGQVRIKETIERAQELAGRDRHAEARALIAGLPDEPEQIREVKRRFLEQLDQTLAHKALERAVERSRMAVERRDFSGARREVRAVPDDIAQVREIKGKLMEQIDQAQRASEGAARLKARVDRAIEEAKQAVGRDDFAAARRAIDGLPNDPQLRELKRNYRNQIDEAERTMSDPMDQIKEVMDRLERRGFDAQRCAAIAQANDIKLNSPRELLGFLLSLEQQI
jgi:hypothetical protein